MKAVAALVSLLILAGCAGPAQKSADLSEVYLIRAVRFFEADGRLPEHRAILCGDYLFRDASELAQLIEAIQPSRSPEFVIHHGGTCDPEDPILSQSEVDLITEACARRGLRWRFWREQPNQALQPTPMLVTPRADARVAPSTGVADL